MDCKSFCRKLNSFNNQNVEITMPVITWGGESTFEYDGCVENGTTIKFGKKQKATISTDDWQRLRKQFLGKIVEIGTSRDNPPSGSMGKWFCANIKKQALMSYVGPILIREGYAIRESDTSIRVVR